MSLLSHNVSTRVMNRPGINFGNGMIFSGTITPIVNTVEYIRRVFYIVNLEMPTASLREWRLTTRQNDVNDTQALTSLAAKMYRQFT